MERGLVERESALPFRAIRTAAVRGRNPFTLLRNSTILAQGVWEARELLRRERPAAILGTGGYVCVPLFVAARQLGVPSLVYLPDIVPGLAIKLLSRLATRVVCSFEPSLQYLPQGKTVVTGYPVRSELFEADPAESRAAFGIVDELPVVVVYGGSRGARSVNRAIEALLPDLVTLAHVIHVCGREGDERWLRAAAERLPQDVQGRYHVFPYLHSGHADTRTRGHADAEGVYQNNLPLPPSPHPRVAPTMVQAFAAADLAIARSGASTLAELPAAKLPAVLVPYPYVYQDENADYLVARGAAVKVADGAMLGAGDPRAGALWPAVQRLLNDHAARAVMAERSAALARPDAAAAIAHELLRLAAHGGAA
jgi:UDP-N-acetylglucosamine--N-acetylmuramyl-(pentapeptide) pyrophosphoryl-undecaprenol N-acetylglucosamine transferase